MNLPRRLHRYDLTPEPRRLTRGPSLLAGASPHSGKAPSTNRISIPIPDFLAFVRTRINHHPRPPRGRKLPSQRHRANISAWYLCRLVPMLPKPPLVSPFHKCHALHVQPLVPKDAQPCQTISSASGGSESLLVRPQHPTQDRSSRSSPPTEIQLIIRGRQEA